MEDRLSLQELESKLEKALQEKAAIEKEKDEIYELELSSKEMEYLINERGIRKRLGAAGKKITVYRQMIVSQKTGHGE